MKLKAFPKKLLAIVLTIAISLSFMGGVAFAGDEPVIIEEPEQVIEPAAAPQESEMEIVAPDVEVIAQDAAAIEEMPEVIGQEVQVGTYDALVAAIAAAGKGGDPNIKLTASIVVTGTLELTPSIKTPITIDGGGFSLTRADIFPDFIVSVSKGCKLTLKNIILDGEGKDAATSLASVAGELVLDSGAVLQGNVTLRQESTDGSGVAVLSGGVLTINNGAAIKENESPQSFGGAIYVQKGGAVVMNGGAIDENLAFFGGGGAYMEEGTTFTMNGGSMNGNSGSLGGCIFTKGTFAMNNDALINSCNGGNNGGGVWVDGLSSASKLVMTGNSKITNCAAEVAGGAIARAGGVIEMSGNSSISGNTSRGYGGGSGVSPMPAHAGGVLVVSNSALYMKDNASINGNILSDEGGDPMGGADVYLAYDGDGLNGKLFIEGGASIGTSSKGAVSAGVLNANELGNKNDNIIVSGALTAGANIAIESIEKAAAGTTVAVGGSGYPQLSETDLGAFAYGNGSRYNIVFNNNTPGDPAYRKSLLLEDGVIPIERIEITPSKKAVYAGNSYTFTAKVYPKNATEQVVRWSLSNDSKATLTPMGDPLVVQVNAKKHSRINLIAEAMDGSGVVAKALVEIKVTAKLTGGPTSPVKIKKGETISFPVKVQYNDGSTGNASIATSNQSVARVYNNGLVIKGVRTGEAIITYESTAYADAVRKIRVIVE